MSIITIHSVHLFPVKILIDFEFFSLLQTGMGGMQQQGMQGVQQQMGQVMVQQGNFALGSN